MDITNEHKMVKNNNIRLIKGQGRDGDTWICQELFPAETWKNRPLWKPVTRALYRAEVLSWLTRNIEGPETLAEFTHLVN